MNGSFAWKRYILEITGKLFIWNHLVDYSFQPYCDPAVLAMYGYFSISPYIHKCHVNNCFTNHCKLIIIIGNHLILPDYAQSIRRRKSISIMYLFMLCHVQHWTNEYYVKTVASLKPSVDESVFNYCITTNPEEGEEELHCVITHFCVSHKTTFLPFSLSGLNRDIVTQCVCV